MNNTGESGVYQMTKERHDTDVYGQVECYVHALCDMYHVDYPKVVVRDTNGGTKLCGSYYPNTETIVILKPSLGVVLHETAHHINYVLYGCNGHGTKFKELLSEIYYCWR